MVYLVCFAASLLFAYCAEQSKKKFPFIMFSIISIAIPVLLAGFRDISIGTDTVQYYNNLWGVAIRSKSLGSFLSIYSNFSSNEFAYALIMGITAKTTGNYHVFLTIVHVIIITGVYAGAFRLKKYAKPVFTLALFYLLYYNHSLNIIRQYMAMAILFAATIDILERKYIRYLIAFVFAFLMHNSAVLGILPLLIFIFLYPRKRITKVPLWRRILIIVLIIAVTVSFFPLARFFIRIGLVNSKYSIYLTEENETSYGTARLLLAFEMILLMVKWVKIRKSVEYANFFLISTIAFFSLYQLAPFIMFGKRIAGYFSLYNIVTLGMAVNANKIKSNRVIIAIGILAVALVYWFFIYVRANASQTYPYVLGF